MAKTNEMRNGDGIGVRYVFRDPYLLGLIIFALFYWKILFVGTGSAESLAISKSGWELAEWMNSLFHLLKSDGFPNLIEGIIELRASMGINALANSMPLALLYTILGPNELSNQVLVSGTALLSLVLIYYFSRSQFGKNAALAASLFWICVPIHATTTSVLGAQTIPMLMTMIGFFAAWAIFGSADSKSTIFAIIIFFLVLLVDPWMGMAFFVYLVGVRILPRINIDFSRAISWAFAFALMASFFLGAFVDVGVLYTYFVTLPGASLLIVILLLAIFHSGRKGFSKMEKPFIVCLIPVFALLMSLLTGSGSFEDLLIYLLPVMVFFAVLVGAFLAEYSPKKLPAGFLVLTASLVLFLVNISISAQGVLIPVSGEMLLSWESALFYVFQIMAGILVTSLFLLSFIGEEGVSRKSAIIFISLLAFLLVAWTPSSWEMIISSRARNEAALSALSALKEQELSLHVVIMGDEQLRDQLSFYQGYSSENALKVSAIAFEREINVENAFVLTWDIDHQSVNNNGFFIRQVGVAGEPRINIFRLLSGEAAENEYFEAHAQFASNPNLESAQREFGALVNLGKICEAIQTYFTQLTSTDLISDPLMVLVPNSAHCFAFEADNQVELMLAPGSYYPVYRTAEMHFDAESQMEYVRTSVKLSYFADPRKSNIEQPLDGASVYYYQATIRTSEQVMALYWSIDGVQDYGFAGRFDEFSNLEMFIVVPAYSQEIVATISPFLFNNFGNHDISFLGFSKLETQ